MNVCSIDSRAAMGGRTLIRMLGSTGLQISFDQEIANVEKRRQILRKKEMTTFERRWRAKITEALSDLLPKAAVKLSSSLLKFRAWLYKCHIMMSWISLWSDPSQRGRAMISDIWAATFQLVARPNFPYFPDISLVSVLVIISSLWQSTTPWRCCFPGCQLGVLEQTL